MNNHLETTKTTKTRNRSFNIYQTEIRIKNRQHNSLNNLGWTSNHCKDIQNLFNLIYNLDDPIKTRRGDENNPWTMRIERLQIVNNENNKPVYLQGYFLCSANGVHTPLLDNQTLELKENPKGMHQNETLKTAFSLRFNDGMFIISEYQGNVATKDRISKYLNYFITYFITNKKLKTDIKKIILHHKIKKGFLDKINGFSRLDTIEINLDFPQGPNKDNAMNTLGNELTGANIGTISLTLKRKSKEGIIISKAKEWLSTIEESFTLKKGELIGDRGKGKQEPISLNGINERYKYSLYTDEYGDVLVGELYKKIEKLNVDIPLFY